MSYSLFSIRVLILLLKRTLCSIILPDQFRTFCMRIFSFFLPHKMSLFLFHFPLYVTCGAFNYIPRVYFERCWFAFKQTNKKVRPLDNFNFFFDVRICLFIGHIFVVTDIIDSTEVKIIKLKLKIMNIITSSVY